MSDKVKEDAKNGNNKSTIDMIIIYPPYFSENDYSIIKNPIVKGEE